MSLFERVSSCGSGIGIIVLVTATTLASGIAETMYVFTAGDVLVMNILGTLCIQYSDVFETWLLARTADEPAGE